MIQHAERGTYSDARIPLWRRVTALFSLSALVVVVGILLAAVIGTAVLLMLFLVERAIAG
jgi:hypothetical protein